MTTQSRPPTARELVAARKRTAIAPADANQKAEQPTVPAAPPKTTAVTAPDDRPYVTRYLDETAPSGVVGRLVRFKDGDFVTTDDDKVLPEAEEFTLLADDTLVGWLKFNGPGEAPDRVMGLLFDGFVMPPRESLGDLDEKAWELGLDGQPQDPWQHQQCLVLQNTATAELFTFTTNTRTGRRAVGNLLRSYTRMKKTHPDELPVIRLGKGGFNHKDSRVGWVDVPVFIVVGRAPRDSTAKPDTSTEAFLNDALPF
jgi:hypothetical protein